MQLGMIGLGRMGASMVERLLIKGHQYVVHDMHPEAIARLQKKGAAGATSLQQMVLEMTKPRAIWMMLPATIVDQVLDVLVPLLDVRDIVIDGGNSYYRDNIRRGAEEGFLHCGPHGAGHFVKMIHNGIEYGVMAAYAEGLNILCNANVGKHTRDTDAETAPLQNPEFYSTK